MSVETQTGPQDIPRAHAPATPIRRGEIKISDPIAIPREGKDGLGPQDLRSSTVYSSSPLAKNRHSQGSAMSNSQSASQRRQTSYNPATPFHNPQDSISSTTSKVSATQKRRGSALKNVMRKIFGRKPRDVESPTPITRQHQSMREHPTNPVDAETTDDAFVTMPNSLRANRPPSLKLQKAKVSQSVDLGSGGDPSKRQDGGLPFPADYRRPRRRMTLPSLILSPTETRDLAAAMIQDDARLERQKSTSDGRRSTVSLQRRSLDRGKRRSRSAGALRGLSKEHRMSPIQWRRRSHEMSSWKDSVEDGVDNMVSAFSQADTEEEDDSDLSVTSDDDKDMASIDRPGSSEMAAGIPFDFGQLVQDNDGVSVEQRITTLEVKLMDLELAISKLQNHDPNARTSRKRTPTPGSEPVPPSFLSTPSATPPRSSPPADARPISTTTVRPNTSVNRPYLTQNPSLSASDFGGITIEQYSALTTLVRREQSSRKLLELQVNQLQKDMQRLQGGGDRNSVTYSRLQPSRSAESPVTSTFPRGRARIAPTSNPRSRRDDETESDTDESRLGSYRTAAEQPYTHRVHLDALKRSHLKGMI
ncbi:hypothetical protein FQN54_007859 [Arachnomyces sp. PD_36]|nr:hypothetical protein FQN54_007859 [Arachnomyces sp. PD_36]